MPSHSEAPSVGARTFFAITQITDMYTANPKNTPQPKRLSVSLGNSRNNAR